MEEDIKILEKYIDETEGALKIWQIETINECEDLRVAIENLIERYKELEEKQNKNIQVAYGGRRYNTEGIVIENYIPKSKVKEKMKSIGDYSSIGNDYDYIYAKGQYELCVELLEES